MFGRLLITGYLATFSVSPALAQQIEDREGLAALNDSPSSVSISRPEIIVEATKVVGSSLNGFPVLQEIDSDTIKGLSVASVSEIVDALGPQFKSPRSEGLPIFLLNGRRVESIEEVVELPPEAIASIQVLPEEYSLRLGLYPNRRVVNFNLRPGYRATEFQLRGDIPLSGEGGTVQGKLSEYAFSNANRENYLVKVRQQSPTLITGDMLSVGDRTLLPESTLVAANGVFVQATKDFAFTMRGSGSLQIDTRILGRGMLGMPLSRRSRQLKGGVGLALDGGNWRISASVDLQKSVIDTDSKIEKGLSFYLYNTSDSSISAQFDANVSRTLMHFRGDEITTSISFGGYVWYWPINTKKTAEEKSSFNRSNFFGAINFDIPLASQFRWAMTIDGRIDLSQNSPLGRYGVSLRGNPLSRLELSGAYSSERLLPRLEDLSAPDLITPNVRVYDFKNGEIRYVDRLTGGNVDLRPSNTNLFSFNVNYRLNRNIYFSSEYTSSFIKNEIISNIGLNTYVENAFSYRFDRENDRLYGFDGRPLNLFSSERQAVLSNFQLNLPISPGSRLKRGLENQNRSLVDFPGGRLEAALFHNWMLKNKVEIQRGSPKLDLLSGAGISSVGGSPAHRFDAQLGFAEPRFGLRFSGKWSSPTRLNDTFNYEQSIPRALVFRYGLNVGLRSYLDLTEIGAWRRHPWLIGRVTLELDNIFKSAIVIRDEKGGGVQYDDGTDPLSARAIRLTFRRNL